MKLDDSLNWNGIRNTKITQKWNTERVSKESIAGKKKKTTEGKHSNGTLKQATQSGSSVIALALVYAIVKYLSVYCSILC